jgi:alkanesulfonate monooxygenase SsuD/methylene tetrahydromethanopterin reductase-like flavin-dependent oxidoreductase (luciferase family)
MDRLTADTPMNVVWGRTLELARMADEGGFEIILTAEHHTIEVTIAPNPFQVLCAWAQHVKRARLGTAVLSASYWHPIRLAGEAALADIVTGGRLEMGIGRGSYQYEFDRMRPGTPQQEGVAYMKEIVPAVRALWNGNYAHDGHYWSFPETTSVPRPLQDPVPMWCAARDQGSFDWAIQNGMNIMATPLHAPHVEVENLVQKFNNTVNRNPDVVRPRFMMLRRTAVYESPCEWTVPVESLINYGRYFENLFKNLGGVSFGFPHPVDHSVIANRSDYEPASLRENMIFGTPEELGIDYFLYGAFFGMPYDWVKRSLQLFVREVMPKFA